MLKSAQRGIVDPKIIIGGIIVLVVIFFIATGSLKFSASIKPTGSEPQSTKQQTQESAPAAPSKPKTYENTASNISLEYPASWSMKENPTPSYIVVFSSPKEGSSDNYSEGLGIKVVDTSSQPNITLQEIADLWENQTKKAAGTFVVNERKSSTFVGEAAKDIIYNFKDQGSSGKGMVRITLKNKKAYIFQYNALEKTYDKYLPDIETILASVKF